MAIIGDKNIKELTGTVVSDKMDKTIVVSVSEVKLHRLYKKRFTVYKKYFVHDEENVAKKGNVVKIRQAKPISKKKRWNMVEIIQDKVA